MRHWGSGFGFVVGIHLHGNLSDAWNRIHIPANSPLFSEHSNHYPCHRLRHSRSGSFYTVSSFDPWHRLYNYPPIWLLARYFGVSSASSNLIGFASAVAGISTYLFLFNARTLISGFIVFFALASRCVLFSVERGNTDQVIFFLLVFGFFLIHRQRPELASRLTGVLIVFLTVLKIYPIVTATVFLQCRRGWISQPLPSELQSAPSFSRAARRSPLSSPTHRAIPICHPEPFPFFTPSSQHTMQSMAPFIVQHRAAAPLIALLTCSVCLLVGAKMHDRLHHFLPPLDSNLTRGAVAIASLSIFCFAFIAGSSYNYRLIYLTGPLAWLVEDITTKAASGAHFLYALLILVLLRKPFSLSSDWRALRRDGLPHE